MCAQRRISLGEDVLTKKAPLNDIKKGEPLLVKTAFRLEKYASLVKGRGTACGGEIQKLSSFAEKR